MAAEFATIPVINAGSGAEEHPTQALLDLYTIRKELGTIDGLTIGLIGDLGYGRTVHSLAYALSLYKVKLVLISPDILQMRKEVAEEVSKKIDVTETPSLKEHLRELDVIHDAGAEGAIRRSARVRESQRIIPTRSRGS